IAHGGPDEGEWSGPVPATHAPRGFYSVTLGLADPVLTAWVLEDVLGFVAAGEEDGRRRYRVPGAARAAVIDLVRDDTLPRPGSGTVHHVAFRARDDAEQAAWREAVEAAGLQVTEVKDRLYFRSIYFREPGGVLFEIATDGPGFLVDEDAAHLGEALKLPPWMEVRRDRIEQRLPPLHLPTSPAPNP
ncbi:MAG: VOC family protein, partial [Rhodothermales bacterium]|nr:VOC family protein [Rhodothermales bacterium]